MGPTKGIREGPRDGPGAFTNLWILRSLPNSYVLSRVLGQSSPPMWVLGTMECIWAGGIPLKPHQQILPPQNNFLRDIFVFHKGPRAKMLPQNLPRGRFWALFQIAPKGAHSQS